jgi:hypothetical protein
MRSRLIVIMIVLGLAVRLAAGTPPLLDTAIRKLQADEDHWAYTQTTQEYDRDEKDKEGVTVERYDPSLPEDQQWTLRQYKGREPTDREVRSWEKRKRKELKRREEKTLGEVMDFERAHAVSENSQAVIFEIPLLPGASKRLPSEKFVVQMTVDPVRQTLQAFDLKTLGSFRTLGVAKIENIHISASFQIVDEQYAPQPARIEAQGTGKILFFRVGGSATVTWSDFKRVKPYRDRFEVQIGELKAFGF